MGRHSTTGGGIAVGQDRIQFAFQFGGRRFRPTLLMTPSALNLARIFDASRRVSQPAPSRSLMSFPTIGIYRRSSTPTSYAPAIECSMSSLRIVRRGARSTTSRKQPFEDIERLSIGSGVRAWVR